MPVYNAESFLEEAINSILRQTFYDFEFIIINDGSTDKTEEIILSYKDSRILYQKNEKNSGIVYTLNKGFSIASGMYIARMDADDIAHNDRFEKQVSYLESHPEVAVCGTDVSFIGGFQGNARLPTGSDWIKANMFFSCAVAHPTVLIRRKVLFDNDFLYDSHFEKVEDYDLWCRIAEKYEINNCPEPLLDYRIHEKQITQNYDFENEKRMYQLKKRELLHLGFVYNDNEFNAYLKCCTNFPTLTLADINHLEVFFRKAYDANEKVQYYNSQCFYKIIQDCLWRCINQENLTVEEAKSIMKNSFFIGKKERILRWMKEQVKKLVGR